MRILTMFDELHGAGAGGKDAAASSAESRPAMASDGLVAHGVSHRDLLRLFHGGQPLSTAAAVRPSLTVTRRREIRQRLLDGSYTSPAAVDRLARTLLASGEL